LQDKSKKLSINLGVMKLTVDDNIPITSASEKIVKDIANSHPHLYQNCTFIVVLLLSSIMIVLLKRRVWS